MIIGDLVPERVSEKGSDRLKSCSDGESHQGIGETGLGALVDFLDCKASDCEKDQADDDVGYVVYGGARCVCHYYLIVLN